ncbi:hypothetical protein KHA94_16125 [Bacillus sp. FJAT-49705]|uniref:DUF4179 domain-containing protein n=1 Tax=Cytobacillus citreus TaxID=2833586 RepID=A0ABS5NX46_9BACI|nr:hypothetical protein [Cytobacillus citreus]MBS4191718.1 hypothetical protein [Cytobacillus citreus]
MTHLSDKHLLEKMRNFPDYELTCDQRDKVMMAIRANKGKNKKANFYWRKAGAICAVLAIFIIVPILLFENLIGEIGNQTGNVTPKAVSAVHFPLIDESGNPTRAEYNFGIPNKASIFGPPEWVAEDYRGVGKLFAFLWGEKENLLNKELQIIGIHTDTGLELEMTNNLILSSSLYDATAHALTSFKVFPHSGNWNLKFMLEGKEYATFSIYVKEPYVQVGDSTLLISQEDLQIGHYKDVSLDITGSNLPEQIEVELFSLEDRKKEVFIFKDKMDFIRADTMKNGSSYTGELTLRKSGKYRLKILDHSTIVEVKKAEP